MCFHYNALWLPLYHVFKSPLLCHQTTPWEERLPTAILSDLHLGAAHGDDLLRYPFFCNLLREQLDGIDHIVLLGDILDLRFQQLEEALLIATPFLTMLGDVLAVPGIPGSLTSLATMTTITLYGSWKQSKSRPLNLANHTAFARSSRRLTFSSRGNLPV